MLNRRNFLASSAASAMLSRHGPHDLLDALDFGSFAQIREVSIPPYTRRLRTVDRGTIPIIQHAGPQLSPQGRGIWWEIDVGGTAWRIPFDCELYASWFGIGSNTPVAQNSTALGELFASGSDIYFDCQGEVQVDRLIEVRGENFVARFSPDARLRQLGRLENSTMFRVRGKENIRIVSGTFTPGTETEATLHGWCWHFVDCSNCYVERITGTGHRRGVAVFESCSRSGWINPLAVDSCVDPKRDDHRKTGVDFLYTGNCRDCHSHGGTSIRGSGIGFAIQSMGGAPATFRNVSISGFTVREAPVYGAMAYRTNLKDSFSKIEISASLIDTVFGSVPWYSPGHNNHMKRPFGAGIYIQGVENAIVHFGTIAQTNLHTDIEQLAPGAVGITNCHSGSVTGERIVDAHWYGVVCADPNKLGSIARGAADAKKGGEMAVDIGEIVRPQKTGAYQKDFPRLKLSALITDALAHGFLSRDTSTESTVETQLVNLRVVGGAGALPAVETQAGRVIWTGGFVRDFEGRHCWVHSSPGGATLSDVILDGSGVSGGPIRITEGPGEVIFGSNVRIIAPTAPSQQTCGDAERPIRGLIIYDCGHL